MRGCNRSPTWPCLTASIRAHVWHPRRRAQLACVYGCRRISAHRSFIELPTKLSVRARRYATTEVENAALTKKFCGKRLTSPLSPDQNTDLSRRNDIKGAPVRSCCQLSPFSRSRRQRTQSRASRCLARHRRNAQRSLLRKFIDCDFSAPHAQPSSKIVPSLRIGFRIGVIGELRAKSQS